MEDRRFRALLNLYMVNDPWPLTSEDDQAVHELLNEESEERGYEGWTEAYHNFDVEAAA